MGEGKPAARENAKPAFGESPMDPYRWRAPLEGVVESIQRVQDFPRCIRPVCQDMVCDVECTLPFSAQELYLMGFGIYSTQYILLSKKQTTEICRLR